jgi:predicted pyridoxine 5'-phosphate oxidase superfamily flavin-nucleotide-binding protein
VTVERRARRFASAAIERSARQLLNASPLCALATVTATGRAHVNHMYFAWSDRFEIFWISDPESVHSRNLERNQSAAITVYASNQVWGKPDRGIQLFGRAGVTRGREAPAAYSKRFRDFDAEGNDLPFYRFKPRTVKVFDERSLAGGTLVTARVGPAGLMWVKTEVWA